MATTDNLHEEARDLLAAYALDIATPAERHLVERHLTHCHDCQRELVRLQHVVAVLPLAAEERQPSPRLRSELTRALPPRGRPLQAPSPRTEPHRSGMRLSLAWAVAACFLLMSLALLTWNLELRSQLRSRTIPIVLANGERIGTARYLSHDQVVVLVIDKLPVPPPGQVYQVWLLQKQQPVPMATFASSSARIAIAADPSLAPSIAITLEPGPLGSPQPTTQPLVVIDLTTAART